MFGFNALDLLKKKDNSISYKIEEDLKIDDEDLKSKGITSGEGSFSLRNGFILATGSFKSPVELICDRCNKPYLLDIDFDIDEAIQVVDKVNFKAEIEFTTDDIHEQVTSEEEINVIDFVRQYLILNLPSKRLCSEDCTNELFEEYNNSFENDIEEIDPRLAKLILFKENMKENGNGTAKEEEIS